MRSRSSYLLPLGFLLSLASLSLEAKASPSETPAALEAQAPSKKAPARQKRSKAKGESSKSGPVALFAGFRMLPGGDSRVYVDLSSGVPVTKREGERELVYRLKGARLSAKNNQNALVTTYFDTPVARARLVPVDDDLELVIELRDEAAPAHRVLRKGGTLAQLQIDFPAATKE